MIFLFLYFSTSKYHSDQCVAPIKLPVPLENGTLLQAQVLIRHGSRTPGSDFFDSGNAQEWHCDENDAISPRLNPAPVNFFRSYHDEFDSRIIQYKPSCREKDLLTLGMQQHFELGQEFKKLYHEKLEFIPKNINPSFFYARSSETDRTLRSAISFIQGMFPPASPNEIIPIVTDSEAAGLLHPKDYWCHELEGIVPHMYETEQFKDFFSEFTKKFRDSYPKEISKKWETKKVKKFCSWIVMTQCSNHAIPNNITQELQDSCLDLVNNYLFMQHDNEKYRGVGSAPLFREMFRIADNLISEEEPYKFIVLSSHDTALAAYLATLGYDYKNKPPIPVRSHLVFELWEISGSIYARYVFNGEPLKVNFLDNATLFPYSKLKGEMSKLGLINHCFIPEWK
ncbi:histidine acid phosphatase [Tritrichomonas foetus]|uniref:Histidine acid phosphatase n=1 Tax=Tritrichomonas foetus TaxID=1144522 RepID=A0A1J4JHR5_9EUKA|nr:histidine acid phosphatase [Tritrichomonas foetus]|eukprot:OHS98704.1 histidine acid phosphatase [Tritrichomonas foetus]